LNFYKRFIGDIQAKTGDLSLCEFGAYDRLLDHYYSTEQPIPGGKDKCYRICRAMSKDERLAVDKVLGQFFSLTPEGYVQSKAAEMIAKAQPLIEAARANGKRGGRPKKITQQEPSGFSKETQGEPSSKATQSQSHSSLRSEVNTGEQDFAEAFDAYPKRPGASKADSLKAWTARVKAGVDPAVILAGVRRYAAYCIAAGTEPGFIKQPATFFGPGEHYLSDWTPPAAGSRPATPNKFSAAAAGIFGAPRQEAIDV
jgi:uncharacterized protein YdaU (DUF1376 family)